LLAAEAPSRTYASAAAERTTEEAGPSEMVIVALWYVGNTSYWPPVLGRIVKTAVSVPSARESAVGVMVTTEKDSPAGMSTYRSPGLLLMPV
jgi:hypothetical protein